MRPTSSLPLLLVALGLAAGACGEGSRTYPIDERRTLAAPRPEQTVPADTRERLLPPPGDPHAGRSMGEDPHAGRQGAGSLAFDLPQGWSELPPTEMRNANFAIAGHDQLECYVSILPGGGGGIAANVNRWRKQMGLDPMAEANVASLPRVKLFGDEGPYVELDGTYHGAGGAAPREAYTMAATIVEQGGASLTAKLVGPSADVRAEVEHFKTLCASLRMAEPAPHDAAPPAPEAGGFDPSRLAWKAPAGWTEGPPKSMRVVTFVPANGAGAECYVTVLSGQAGGVAANVNRWRSQLGVPALSEAEIAALATVPVLGRDARMVEIDGGAQGLLGIVCDLGSHSVFVKMTGPMETLKRERENFIAFCRSLS